MNIQRFDLDYIVSYNSNVPVKCDGSSDTQMLTKTTQAYERIDDLLCGFQILLSSFELLIMKLKRQDIKALDLHINAYKFDDQTI